ncbi:putative sec7 domain-containing protein [Golovinomyces cichoracearum]|uniref:Putative sec7 domain-containing protein n=1 Tax=Golovinomyces cichoracearum TaxID=62708 RepID=A0A420IIK3_9PEZI|nr:putative sec7 domain-containing protein [Golovinomyces cichoracearum]
MLLDEEEEDVSKWTTLPDQTYSQKLNKTALKNRDKACSPSPTSDDETACATHTAWAPLLIETFLDDITPINSPTFQENKNNSILARKNRDSHELALSPRAPRQSLVDHMLLSFDQLKPNHSSVERKNSGLINNQLSESEENPYLDSSEDKLQQSIAISAAWGGDGKRQETSYNNDGENVNELSRYPTGRYTRSRRKNNNAKAKALADMGVRERIDPELKCRSQAIHGKSHRSYSQSETGGNKSNNCLNLIYSQSISSPEWARQHQNRSSSFDYVGENHTYTTQRRGLSTNCGPYHHSVPLTPVIPYGLRPRLSNSEINLHHDSTNLKNSPKKLDSKKSSKSIRSSSRRRNSIEHSNNPNNPIISSTTTKILLGNRNNSPDRSHDLPPVPTQFNERQAAHCKVRKESSSSSTNTTTSPAASNSRAQSKERQGFFRRVFGHPKNNVSNNPHRQLLEQSPPHGSSLSIEKKDQLRNRTPPTDHHLKSDSARETCPTPSPSCLALHDHSHSEFFSETMPQLNKKPSSFFRRRKKSGSNSTMSISPAMLLRTPSKETPVEKMLPHPPTSLPSVIHPYLQKIYPSIDQLTPENFETYQDMYGEVLRSLSPSYEPVSVVPVRSGETDEPEITQSPGSRSTNHQFSMWPYSSRDPGSDSDEEIAERDTVLMPDNSERERDAFQLRSVFINPRVATSVGEKAPVLERNYVSESLPFPRKFITDEDGTFSWSRSSPLIPRQQMTEPAFSIRKTHIARQHSEDWVKITQSKTLSTTDKDDRVWLEPSSSEEEESIPSQLDTSECILSNLDHIRSLSKSSIQESIASSPDSFLDKETDPNKLHDNKITSKSPIISEAFRGDQDEVNDATIKDLEISRQIYEGIHDVIPKHRAAAWLGEEERSRGKVLEAYFGLYNFTNLNILAALRNLCDRLVLKAESQQVDRILLAFSHRWSECNPCHGFKSTDVIHTIAYSLILLNTDLHLAEIEQKMTRNQFTKNTLATIKKIVTDLGQDAFDHGRPTILPGKCTSFEQDLAKQDLKINRASMDVDGVSPRFSIKPSMLKISTEKALPTPLDYEIPNDNSGPLVRSSFRGTLRTWEVQMEIILKGFYSSIRNERLSLSGSLPEKSNNQGSTSNNLSTLTNNVLRRTPSVLSHTPSETQSYRSRAADTLLKVGNGKRSNKNRSRPRLYPAVSGLGSSRTSLDDQSSMWSPVSSTWSKYSLGKTPTSVSVDSLGSACPNEEYQQSIGFANAISQAIIREEMEGNTRSYFPENNDIKEAHLLEDESLELHGAPWAKEGMVKHKHHLESLDKKARERNWSDVFAVIEKGYLTLFSFSSKSIRQKTKDKPAQFFVGGGNWQENAENLGSFLLQQTIASALPSPGYSKSRPHVWALSLPTGAVHLFQVGTPEIVKEFVSTANYWGARLSNHPLVGGISNIEYGWSDYIIKMVENNSQTVGTENPKKPTTGSRNRSMSGLSNEQSSGRVSLDQVGFGVSQKIFHGDKISLTNWTPPTQSMRASNLAEHDQLRALTIYVSGIEEELQKHNKLRNTMLLAFSPRHPNTQKAMANWGKKSAYLLREIVKFRTYIDCLQAAEVSKGKIYKEREENKKENQILSQTAEN